MKPWIEKQIYELFWESLTGLKKPKEVEEFYLDLLTYTEKIVLAKRLAIAMLLVRGLGYDEIKEILKVSDPTITRVRNQLRSGSGFSHLAQRLANRDFWREFVEDFEKLTAMYPRRKKRYPKFPFNV
ncbi:MAG: Trp family transcriptional regulator [Patescibacteria group bacterium]